jgi:hypothetical protein
MTPQEFRDLGKLARNRTREAALSVSQLLDDDHERAALLVSVAVDFINGATVMVGDDERSEHEALGHVLGMIFLAIGQDKVMMALTTLERRSR